MADARSAAVDAEVVGAPNQPASRAAVVAVEVIHPTPVAGQLALAAVRIEVVGDPVLAEVAAVDLEVLIAPNTAGVAAVAAEAVTDPSIVSFAAVAIETLEDPLNAERRLAALASEVVTDRLAESIFASSATEVITTSPADRQLAGVYTEVVYDTRRRRATPTAVDARLPITVRIRTGNRDHHITRDLRSLKFRSVAPGGFAWIQCSLDRPLAWQPDDVDYYAHIWVYDRRSAAVLCEGRVEDPQRSLTGDGQVWSLTAVGPSAHARDRTIPLVYVDRSTDSWGHDPFREPHITAESAVDDTDGPTLRIAPPSGVTATVTPKGGLAYRRLAVAGAGQSVARFSFTAAAGENDTDWKQETVVRPSTVDAGDLATQRSFSTTPAAQAAVVGTDFTAGYPVIEVRIRRFTSTVTASDDTWAEFRVPVVRALLKDAAGADITTGYTADTILGSEVVADLLGRLLPAYDGPGATVAATSYEITDFSFPDGVCAADVLAALMALEPEFTWGAWESNKDGRHRFEWKPWPTAVRYETEAGNGFESPGSAGELFNSVRVFYDDPSGLRRCLQRTQTVDVLDAAGLVRDAVIDVQTRTAAEAERAGDAFLAEHATPPNAGTLTVSTPVRDIVQGCLVMPWEIVPGELIRVRGVRPQADVLNAAGRDGVTVFRIAAVEFDSDSVSSRLDLDSYPVSVAAALSRGPGSRRR